MKPKDYNLTKMEFGMALLNYLRDVRKEKMPRNAVLDLKWLQKPDGNDIIVLRVTPKKSS